MSLFHPTHEQRARRREIFAIFLNWLPLWVFGVCFVLATAFIQLHLFILMLYLLILSPVLLSLHALWLAGTRAARLCDQGRREELALTGITADEVLRPLIEPCFRRLVVPTFCTWCWALGLGGLMALSVLLIEPEEFNPVLHALGGLAFYSLAPPSLAAFGVSAAVSDRCRKGDASSTTWILAAWSLTISLCPAIPLLTLNLLPQTDDLSLGAPAALLDACETVMGAAYAVAAWRLRLSIPKRMARAAAAYYTFG